MKEYVLTRGRHLVREGAAGKLRTVEVGESVELTPEQVAAFGDRFEPRGVFEAREKARLEELEARRAAENEAEREARDARRKGPKKSGPKTGDDAPKTGEGAAGGDADKK